MLKENQDHRPTRRTSRLKQLNKSNRRARRHLLGGAISKERHAEATGRPIFKFKRNGSIEDLELDAT